MVEGAIYRYHVGSVGANSHYAASDEVDLPLAYGRRL